MVKVRTSNLLTLRCSKITWNTCRKWLWLLASLAYYLKKYWLLSLEVSRNARNGRQWNKYIQLHSKDEGSDYIQYRLSKLLSVLQCHLNIAFKLGLGSCQTLVQGKRKKKGRGTLRIQTYVKLFVHVARNAWGDYAEANNSALLPFLCDFVKSTLLVAT